MELLCAWDDNQRRQMRVITPARYHRRTVRHAHPVRKRLRSIVIHRRWRWRGRRGAAVWDGRGPARGSRSGRGGVGGGTGTVTSGGAAPGDSATIMAPWRRTRALGPENRVEPLPHRQGARGGTVALPPAVVAPRREAARCLHVGAREAVEAQSHERRRDGFRPPGRRTPAVEASAAYTEEAVGVRLPKGPRRVAWRGSPVRRWRDVRPSGSGHEALCPSAATAVSTCALPLARWPSHGLPLAGWWRARRLRSAARALLRVTEGGKLLRTAGEKHPQQAARRAGPQRSGRRQLPVTLVRP